MNGWSVTIPARSQPSLPILLSSSSLGVSSLARLRLISLYCQMVLSFTYTKGVIDSLRGGFGRFDFIRTSINPSIICRIGARSLFANPCYTPSHREEDQITRIGRSLVFTLRPTATRRTLDDASRLF